MQEMTLIAIICNGNFAATHGFGPSSFLSFLFIYFLFISYKLSTSI
jgi:hypothetical protein